MRHLPLKRGIFDLLCLIWTEIQSTSNNWVHQFHSKCHSVYTELYKYIFMASLLSETLHLLWIEQENQYSAKTEKSKGGNRHRFSFKSIGSKLETRYFSEQEFYSDVLVCKFLFFYWYANFEFLDRASSERNSYQDFHSSFKNFQLIPRTIIISATPIMCESHMCCPKRI